MEKASPDHGSREKPGPSSALMSCLNSTSPEAQACSSRSQSPQSRPTKRHPGLPPLREQPLRQTNLHPLAIRPSKEQQEKTVPLTVSPRAVSSESLKKPETVTIEDEEDEGLYEEEKHQQNPRLMVPRSWKDWISFKLEHFYTGVKFRKDSDYLGNCPVPIECGWKMYYCCQGNMTIRSIRELIELKFCKERKYLVQIMHPKMLKELEETLTLDLLACETKWQRKRPLRIMFTLVPPKEPPPSLEKCQNYLEEAKGAGTAQVAVEDDDCQIIDTAPRVQQPQVVLTPMIQQTVQRTPDHPRQVPIQMTPQYAMVHNPVMGKMVPVKRKRENEETTPPQQYPTQQTAAQQQHQQQMQRPQQMMQMRFNPQQFTPSQLQQLNIMHQRQQQHVLPPEVKNARIATMATAFAQQPPLFPVQVVHAPVRAVPVHSQHHQHQLQQQQQQRMMDTLNPNKQILFDLLMKQKEKHLQQEQQQKMQALAHQQQQQQRAAAHAAQMKQAHQTQLQQAQMKVLHLQAQAVAAAQRAAVRKEGPPPAKKMALQEALESPSRFHQPTPSTASTPEVASTPSTPVSQETKKFQVPSPPSPPKAQPTPSPPSISPIPPKVVKAELKPYAAQVSVKPLTNVKQSTTPTSSEARSPAPSQSPSIPSNIDYVGEAKLKNQSLGRTLKEALAKSHPRPPSHQPPMLIDGLRAQVNGNGELQMSVPASNLELLRNSTIVPTL